MITVRRYGRIWEARGPKGIMGGATPDEALERYWRFHGSAPALIYIGRHR